MSSRYFATVRRVTWIPCDCRMRVICSSVSGRAESSSSISFFTRRFRDQQRRRSALRPVHALAEEIAQLEYALRRMRILAGHRPAHRRRMHPDLLRHFLDHHRLQIVDAAIQKLPLPADDRVADLQNRLLALLDVLDQLDRATCSAPSHSCARPSRCLPGSAASCRSGSAAAAACPRRSSPPGTRRPA